MKALNPTNLPGASKSPLNMEDCPHKKLGKLLFVELFRHGCAGRPNLALKGTKKKRKPSYFGGGPNLI